MYRNQRNIDITPVFIYYFETFRCISVYIMTVLWYHSISVNGFQPKTERLIMKKYYKVVYNKDNKYYSCCAGNIYAVNYVSSKIIYCTNSVEYKINQYVTDNTPLMVFDNLSEAKQFIKRLFRYITYLTSYFDWHEIISQMEIFKVDVVLSEYKVNHINGTDFPNNTVFASHVKLLKKVC